jgi:NodT family efflux transporter outer membrane factor (OMF) lipoprotein
MRTNELNMRATTALATASVAFLLGACASSAGIAPTAREIEPGRLGLGAGTPASDPARVGTDWWRAFGRAELDGLVEQALAGNPGLQVAQARLARAQAGVTLAQASAGARADGSLGVTREHFSATSTYPPPLGGGIFSLASAQLGATWDLDFFGRNRAAIEAAVGAQRAAQADAQAARNLLASLVARSYMQLGRLFGQREVAVRALQQREEMLGLIRQRVQAGLDTKVELRQAEGAVPEMRQQIEQIDEQITLARHALAAFTAQPPAAFDDLAVRLRGVQAVALPQTLPADLLGRRADITAARWRVQAAIGAMQSARAQFYPDINLVAFVGLSSIGLDRLVNAASEQYGVGPALSLPIFDAGRLRAQLSGRAAEVDAAIESYNGAVIDAVHEVADQIGSLRSLQQQQQLQAHAQAAAESAHELAQQRFRAGLGTYLGVLGAETGVLAQRRQALDLQARVLDTQIGLMRALGDVATSQQPTPGGHS